LQLRAIHFGGLALILDEPTSALGVAETFGPTEGSVDPRRLAHLYGWWQAI
jgi:hypothetical protein